MEWLKGFCKSSARDTASPQVQRVGGNNDGEGDEFDDEYPVLREALPFFARDSKLLQVLDLVVEDDLGSLDAEPRFSSSTAPRLAAWSPDGTTLAAVDPADGLVRIKFCGAGEVNCQVLSRTSTAVQQLQWSPKATHLVLVSQSAFWWGEDGESNLQVFKRGSDDGDYTCEASFHQPRCEKDSVIFQWTADERLCCHLLPDGGLQILDGNDLSRPALAGLPLSRGAQAFQFAPPIEGESGYRLAVFMPDTRDSMQRVIASAEVLILELSEAGEPAGTGSSASVEFGQAADLLWSPSGRALLAHCQTDVDDSGQSYYGCSKLLLMSHDTKYTLDLTEAKESAVQAVSWSPTRDEFVLVSGFQPAKVTCWAWDGQAQTCKMSAVLLEKAHRNTIRWNHFGSMVCIAGFGNLAGEMDFFGQTPDGLVRVSSCEASCTVSATWAPDGRHLLTAVLAPRMRVDNGLSVWSCLAGSKVADMPMENLLEVQWRPEPPGSRRFPDVSAAEIQLALGTGEEKKRTAYRPPIARDTEAAGDSNRVAQMMRGEVPDAPEVPDLAGLLARHKATPDAVSSSSAPKPKPEKAEPPAIMPVQSHGDKAPCPTTGWEYMDPKGNKQGPFTLTQMQKWYNGGSFKPTLPMRCDPQDRFTPLKDMFPHPMVPFHRAPKRPGNALRAELRNRD